MGVGVWIDNFLSAPGKYCATFFLAAVFYDEKFFQFFPPISEVSFHSCHFQDLKFFFSFLSLTMICLMDFFGFILFGTT